MSKTVKPNKKTWIYGVGARSQKPPYFPPVVPWISSPLQEEIVSALMAGMTHRLDGQGEQASELERQIDALARQPVLTAVQRRRLHQLRKQRDEVDTQHSRQVARLTDKIRSDVLNFSLIRGIQRVQVQDGQVIFTTAPIKIQGTILGTYDFTLDARYSLPREALWLQRRDRQYPQGPHPHWSGGGPCFGTFGPMLQRVLHKGDFSAAVGMFMNYLAIYDANSPLISLGYFRRSSYANPKPLA